MRRLARLWSAVAAVALVIVVSVVVLTTGGIDRAIYTISGDELKDEEAQLRSELETAPAEATGSVVPTSSQ